MKAALGTALALSLCAIAQAQFIKVAGERHKLVLKSNGAVLRSSGNTLIPFPLPGKAVDIAGAGAVSYAVLDDGGVVGWDGVGAPARVPGLQDALRVAGGTDRFVAVLMKDGTVRTSNGGAFQPVAGMSGIVQISVGTGHLLALTGDGRVLSWGSNYFGALGRPPRREQPIYETGEVHSLSGVTAVAAGNGVSTALKRDGSVWVWGANWQGQFGTGERTDPPGVSYGYELTPRQVAGVASVAAIALGINGRHTLVLLKDGTLRGWGNTDWGQLGAGVGGMFQLRPVTPPLKNVKAVFAAGNNSFAVTTDGAFWAWGQGGRNEWPFVTHTKTPVRVDVGK